MAKAKPKAVPKAKTDAKARTVAKAKTIAKRIPAPKRRLLSVLFSNESTSLDRLENAIGEVRAGNRASVRTTKLLASGVPKMAQKVIEEAAEVAIEGIRGERKGLIDESVDLFYNLLVLFSACNVSLADVWAAMDRREGQLGMAEKLPKVTDET